MKRSISLLILLFAFSAQARTNRAAPAAQDVVKSVDLVFDLKGEATSSAVELAEKISAINLKSLDLASQNDLNRCRLSENDFTVVASDIRVSATLECEKYSFNPSKKLFTDALMKDIAGRQLSALAGIETQNGDPTTQPSVSGSN